MGAQDQHEDQAPMFEGRPITGFEVILPRVTVDAAEQYKGGHILRLATEMRVGNVQFKDNGDGTWTKQHYLTWESVEVLVDFDPADQVVDGGSSSSTAPQVEDAEDLGIVTGRSGDVWPGNVTQLRADAS